MQDRVDARAGGGEQRHRFGERLIDVRHSTRTQEEQRGDERAAGCDRDPPDVVEDRETPDDRPVDAPDADPGVEQLEDRNHQHARSEPAHGMKAIHHHRKARSRSAMAQIRSVIEPIVGPGITTGSSARGARDGSRAAGSHRAGEGNVAHAPRSPRAGLRLRISAS